MNFYDYMYCPFINLLLICQEMKHYIVLVMELCEYDLDHLVKVEPFKEDEIVIFLHQLGKRERERGVCVCVYPLAITFQCQLY